YEPLEELTRRLLRIVFSGIAARDEDRVDLAWALERGLQSGNRHEHGADRLLLRAQREFTKVARRQDLAHGEPHRSAEVFLAAVKRFDRDRRTRLDPQQNRSTLVRPQLLGQRVTDQGIAGLPQRNRLAALKAPEAIVNPVDLHAGDVSAGDLIADHPFQYDHRARRVE